MMHLWAFAMITDSVLVKASSLMCTLLSLLYACWRIILAILHACCLQRPYISNAAKQCLPAMPVPALLVPLD